ncbi:MAG: DUF4150 domain-containing protein [Candidatus Methylopumilus sp.]|nr:DUF4150 domain-containing protein [Candidatus Methylopumilus sp.]
MFANTMASTLNLGFPDVCLVPMPFPVPVPQVNLSSTAMSLPTAPNILMDFMPAQNMLSWEVFSWGDFGVGVACGMCMGPTIPLTGSFTTLLNAMPLLRLSSMNLQNLTNAPGFSVTPSQFSVLCLAP